MSSSIASRIHPSPAIVVRADESIRNCVKLMREKNVGSVLVLADKGSDELVGIFTERDLLLKAELIQSGDHWKRPIRTVMSHPVKTIDVGDLDSAADFLIQNNFRHAPITMKDSEGRRTLAGMISMRDLFKDFVELKRAKKAAFQQKTGAKKGPAYGLYTNDENFQELIVVGLDPWQGKPIKKFTYDAIRRLKLPVLILDIDGLEEKLWADVVREINKAGETRQLVVVFDPSRHEKKAVEILEKLHDKVKTDALVVFEKPVHIPLLLNVVVDRMG